MLAFKALLASIAIFALGVSANRKPKVHKITVGGAAGNVYRPPVVYANPGDYVEFKFLFKNHTVTSSSFYEPCKPNGEFTSGFKPVAMDAKSSKSPKFRLKVEDHYPIWFHCEQTGHCGQGMVGAINPPKKGKHTFKAFQKKAKATAGWGNKRAYPVDVERDEEEAE